MEKKYNVVNGTSYDERTDDSVISILERYRSSKSRVRIFYGSNGKCWNDEYDMIGTIGRSFGRVKIPLIIANRKSIGGLSIIDHCIIDHCIVRIDAKSSSGEIITVYKKEGVRFDHFVSTDIGTVYNETQDKLYARCKSGDAGRRLASFMNGERWIK